MRNLVNNQHNNRKINNYAISNVLTVVNMKKALRYASKNWIGEVKCVSHFIRKVQGYSEFSPIFRRAIVKKTKTNTANRNI